MNLTEQQIYKWENLGNWKPIDVAVIASSVEEAREIIQNNFDSHLHFDGPHSELVQKELIIDQILTSEPSLIKPFTKIFVASYLDG